MKTRYFRSQGDKTPEPGVLNNHLPIEIYFDIYFEIYFEIYFDKDVQTWAIILHFFDTTEYFIISWCFRKENTLSRTCGFGKVYLVFGTLYLVFGTVYLVFGLMNLVFEMVYLVFGVRIWYLGQCICIKRNFYKM